MDSDGVTDMDSDGMNVSDGMNDADGEGGHGVLGESSRHQCHTTEAVNTRPRWALYETGGDHVPVAVGGRARATRRGCGLTRKSECSGRVRFE